MASRSDLLLITTSRRTSNRVRTFIRDLRTVFPNSERFNRGGMSLEELRSRIIASGCSAAFVVTHYKGNPGDIIVYDSSGEERLRIRLESAVLRREVLPGVKIRVNNVASVVVAPGSSDQTTSLAREIASYLNLPIVMGTIDDIIDSEGTNSVAIHFSDTDAGKTLWTYYHVADGTEVGPRMRVKSVRWPERNE